MSYIDALSPLFYADRSVRGRLRLTGRDRQSFLQGMVTNDVLGLTPGDGCYAFLLDATGHVLADARVLCAANYLLLDVEPGTAEFVAATLEKYLIMEKCRVADATGEWAQILVGGVGASDLLRSLFGLEGTAEWREAQNAPFAATATEADRAADSLVARVHLLPFPAFDLYVPADARAAVAARLESVGAVAVSESELETGRIEAGVPRMGVDMDARVLAPETGQEARAIHRRKGCYIGQEIVARIDARGHANRTFAGFRLAGSGLATVGALVEAEGREVGRITSAAFSPAMGNQGASLALGYLRNAFAEPGTAVLVGGTNAIIAALPFRDEGSGDGDAA